MHNDRSDSSLRLGLLLIGLWVLLALGCTTGKEAPAKEDFMAQWRELALQSESGPAAEAVREDDAITERPLPSADSTAPAPPVTVPREPLTGVPAPGVPAVEPAVPERRCRPCRSTSR